jgi:hypothetical protein
MNRRTPRNSWLTQRRRTAIAHFAMGGFAASTLVHIFSAFGINTLHYVPWLWVLHLGALGVVLLLSLTFWPVLSPMQQYRMFFAPLPIHARWAVVGCFIYAILNFTLFFFSAATFDGTPAIQDGQYVLLTHGPNGEQHVMRVITEEEYNWREARIFRAFSGHWMIFYLAPALYFRYTTVPSSTGAQA